jgi:hypothetical protein
MKLSQLTRTFYLVGCLCLFLSFVATPLGAQSTNATLNGQVTDAQGKAVPGVIMEAVSIATNVSYPTKTNSSGIYSFPNLPPGEYRLVVKKDGFKAINKIGLVLHVQDTIEQNFSLEVGSVSESITVHAEGNLINTETATVSTVVDRHFAENLPMNGRSFQTLIQLTPGIVLTAPTTFDGGQFSVNGQRANSNYWMVDGVSANVGASAVGFPGNNSAGALPSLSVLGGTNSLVSVDALQEFRIQTSTYAPEFGRTPGGQISILTRSGTNQFHGTAFDYLRNDVLDANDWFANSAGLPRPKERQNDFGGTFSGPILKDRTFFFFSYEGLRLSLPQTGLSFVPDVAARTNASPAMQPFLNAFPLPNGPEDPMNPGAAQFNAAFSNPASLDAYSLRIDHKLSSKWSIFGRYNYSPSDINLRDAGNTLNTTAPTQISLQTGTVGLSWVVSPVMTNDFRFNYSRTNASGSNNLDNFGGAVPLSSLPFPSPFTSRNGVLTFFIGSLGNDGSLSVGGLAGNLQRQVNLIDTFALQLGSHSLKFGVDFRRLSPVYNPAQYAQEVFFNDVPSTGTASPAFAFVTAQRNSTLLFKNFGAFAQDTWHIVPRLTLTYGLRWDVDFAPSSLNGPSLLAVTGFNLSNLANLALAPAGTPPFQTTYGNVAPRIGVAYQLSESKSWQTVLRGGFGLFYDLATSETGNFLQFGFPFGASKFCSPPSQPPGCASSLTYPFDSITAAPPPITPAQLSSSTLFAFNPHLKLPYTLEWNFAIEQALGKEETLSVSYIGSAGRRLIQSADIVSPNPNFGAADLVGNTATSDYQALQVQFQRRLSRGLQALASYTWSHSIDDGSAGSYTNGSNTLAPSAPGQNRGASNFDIRSAFSAAVTYDIPAPKVNAFANAILHGWSLEDIIQARSAPPVDVFYGFIRAASRGFTSIRPDVVAGVPLYLHGPQYPGGKAFNPAAFVAPPLDPVTGAPLRQGNLSRNTLRAFGAAQWDFAVHRDFPIREQLKLQFRAELFNVLNHPNFGNPSGNLFSPRFRNPQFGVSTQMLGQSLNAGFGGVVGGGAFDPLYQLGGPRSVQFGLKLIF